MLTRLSASLAAALGIGVLLWPPAAAAAPDPGTGRIKVNGDAVRLEGTMGADVSLEFATLMASREGAKVRVLHVDSGGGDNLAAMQIGFWVGERKLSLVVDGACASACALFILPAAARVTLEPNAVIGFHYAPSPLLRRPEYSALAPKAFIPYKFDNSPANALERVLEANRAYYKGLGVDPDAVAATMDIWVEVVRALAERKKAANPAEAFFWPDRKFIRQCLRWSNVETPQLSVSDSLIYARISLTKPLVLLIDGRLYFEGTAISDKVIACPDGRVTIR